MKITISYSDYKQAIIDEAHRLMVQEAIADNDSERKRIMARIRRCEAALDRLETLKPSSADTIEEKAAQEQMQKQLE